MKTRVSCITSMYESQHIYNHCHKHDRKCFAMMIVNGYASIVFPTLRHPGHEYCIARQHNAQLFSVFGPLIRDQHLYHGESDTESKAFRVATSLWLTPTREHTCSTLRSSLISVHIIRESFFRYHKEHVFGISHNHLKKEVPLTPTSSRIYTFTTKTCDCRN